MRFRPSEQYWKKVARRKMHNHPERRKSARFVRFDSIENHDMILTQIQGTVLTKATEYIQYLERQNKEIVLEHRNLTRRVQAIDQIMAATVQQVYGMPAYSQTLFDPRGFC